MARRSLNVLTAFSVLLCVAVLVLWVRSHRVGDRVGWHTAAQAPTRDAWRQASVSSSAGGLTFYCRGGVRTSTKPQRWSPPDPATLGLRWERQHRPSYPRHIDGPRWDLDWRGFAWNWRRSDYHIYDDERSAHFSCLLIVPHAFAAALMALAPGLWAVSRVRRRRRHESGRCPSCDYDLGATPDRCPECGAAPGEPSSQGTVPAARAGTSG